MRDVQYLVGLGGFFFSRVPGRQRAALSPVHVFMGRATFTLGLATMAVRTNKGIRTARGYETVGHASSISLEYPDAHKPWRATAQTVESDGVFNK